MTKQAKKSICAILVVTALIAVAVICRVVTRLCEIPVIEDKILNVVRTLIYLGLFSAWGFSVYRRVMQIQARKFLCLSAILMVLWIMLRAFKFYFITSETAIRYFWYAYYLPMLFIPTLAPFVALSIGKHEGYRLPKTTLLLLVPAVLLLALVLTNDLHQCVFRFPDDAAKVLDKYPNVCFDLTPGCEMYPNFSKRRDVWREFFIKYSDRILFGTDTNSVKNFNAEINELVFRTLTEKGEFVMPCYRGVKIRGLDLPADALENICYNNYVRFTGDKTTEVNRKELYESCEKLLNVMLSEPYDPVYERCAKYLPMLASDPRQSKAITVLKNILNKKV